MDSFVKKVTFKDDTGKKHSYIATFVKVDGGYKISDEDMAQINAAIHNGATWEDGAPEDLEKKADDVKDAARQEAILETISDRQDEGEGLGKVLDEFQEAEINNPESLQEKLHPGKELYSGSEKDAVTDLASGMSLDDAADKARAGQIADAVNKTIIDSVKEGENRDFFKELQDSNSTNASQLHKHLHGDDAELYTEEEKTALGNIANAIRDRWQ